MISIQPQGAGPVRTTSLRLRVASTSVVVMTLMACGGGGPGATRTTTTTPSITPSSASTGATATSSRTGDARTTGQTSTATSASDGTYTLSAPDAQCAIGAASLNGETLTMQGSSATITDPYGSFVGRVEPQGAGLQLTATQQPVRPPPDTVVPLVPPRLDLVITIAGVDTITGTGKLSGVNPSGETGYVTPCTFTGTRIGGLSAGPPYTTGGAAGSGCSPPDAASLPDGWWAGTIVAANGASLDFDVLCYFVGEAANAAAAADGRATPVEDDRYVRNNNPRTFVEAFTSRDVSASCVGLAAEHFPCTVGDVLDAKVNGTGSAVNGHQSAPFPISWIHVTAGVPDFLFVQFTP